MARYRKVDVRVWNDGRFRKLTPLAPSGQAVWLYLLTNPGTTNIPGLFSAGEGGMAEALGWSIKDFRRAFSEAEALGMVKADWAARVVWVPRATSHNRPESPNVVRNWAVAWDEIPECALKAEAYLALKSFLEGFGEGFKEAFREAFGEGYVPVTDDVLRTPFVNQEQEQEQNKETLSAKPTGGEEVFLHWQEVMVSLRSKYAGKRKANVEARLKDGYSVADLKLAVDGCAVTPHNMGENDRNETYNDLELICRDVQHVDRFMANAKNPPRRRRSTGPPGALIGSHGTSGPCSYPGCSSTETAEWWGEVRCYSHQPDAPNQPEAA